MCCSMRGSSVVFSGGKGSSVVLSRRGGPVCCLVRRGPLWCLLKEGLMWCSAYYIQLFSLITFGISHGRENLIEHCLLILVRNGEG